jgi:hypothetical protein
MLENQFLNNILNNDSHCNGGHPEFTRALTTA